MAHIQITVASQKTHMSLNDGQGMRVPIVHILQ